jgi:hypothetical protein
MVSDVNKLAELVQLDSMPSWITDEIESKKDEILEKLRTEGLFVLQSPDGKENIILRPKAKTVAA